MSFSASLAKKYYLTLKNHLSVKPSEFLLKHQKDFGELTKDLAVQLNGLQKAQKKLPTWFDNPSILYPPNLNLEQCSSQVTAQYKASLLKGGLSADLTGGFGIDSYCLAQSFEEHHYVEKDSRLAAIASSNFEVLGATNVRIHQSDGIDWILGSEGGFDLIYLDPSRRNEGGRKFLLEDCEPNILRHHKALLAKSRQVLYKLSPLIDISSVLNGLGQVKTLHVVAVKNECKEVLVLSEQGYSNSVDIVTVNFSDDQTQEVFHFSRSEEFAAKADYAGVDKYVYEPNAAILKSGAFNLLSQRFALSKLHTNTHLYTSSKYLAHWPGRIFELVDEHYTQANIISRNHPLKPAAIAKKLKLKEGGEHYLLAFRDIEKPKMLFAKRLK